jgi:hypothetical protein
LNSLLGTKLKPIAGYPGTQEIMLAIERGELDGIAGYSYRTPPDVVTRAQAIVAAN